MTVALYIWVFAPWGELIKMSHTRVRDMPRNQQRAVFASMGDSSNTSTMQGMQARRETLMKHNLSADTVQDKIDKIMQDRKLTHRQKMDRIAKLKQPVSKSRPSSVGEGSKNDNRFEAPAIKLIYKQALTRAEKRRQGRAEYLKRHPGAVFIPTKEPGVYLLKENGRTHKWIGDEYSYPGKRKNKEKLTIAGKEGTVFKREGLWVSTGDKKVEPKKDYRVDMILPAVGEQKSEFSSSEPMTKKQAETLAREKKKLGFKTARVRKITLPTRKVGIVKNPAQRPQKEKSKGLLKKIRLEFQLARLPPPVVRKAENLQFFRREIQNEKDTLKSERQLENRPAEIQYLSEKIQDLKIKEKRSAQSLRITAKEYKMDKSLVDYIIKKAATE